MGRSRRTSGAGPGLAISRGCGKAPQALVSPAGEDEEFTLKLINRPILVLRGLDGFVCHRRGSNQLDTNRSVYDVFHLSFSDGAYQIRGAGKRDGAGEQREVGAGESGGCRASLRVNR